MRFFLFSLVLSLLASGSVPTLAAPAAIKTQVEAKYQIYGGGMHLIDAELKIDVDKKNYDSQLTARTTGIIGRLFEWWNNVSSKGNVHNRQMQPLEHISENSWLGDRRSVTLVYDGKGGFKKKASYPAPTSENREEVTDELTRNTQDVMSAALTLLQRVTQGENCNQTIAVYDGRRRFNLKFYEVQFEKLPTIRYGIYEGAARRCDMTIERVAGFWKKYQTEWTEDGDAKMRVTFWLAPITPGGPEVPVRARTYGDFGTVFVHLTGGTVDGQDIKDLLDKTR
jgi:hypothetical protein